MATDLTQPNPPINSSGGSPSDPPESDLSFSVESIPDEISIETQRAVDSVSEPNEAEAFEELSQSSLGEDPPLPMTDEELNQDQPVTAAGPADLIEPPSVDPQEVTRSVQLQAPESSQDTGAPSQPQSWWDRLRRNLFGS